MTMSKPLRGALIGCGFVSQHHLAAWRRVEGAEIVALCDLDAGRLAPAAEQNPGARTFREATAMFEADRFDFVEICTRPESHRELVALAARHGTHVLCQKPAAFVRSDLLAMIDDCAEAGVRLMIHENWRFRPWNRALRDEIQRGTIGRPVRLRIVHRDTRALRPDGFSDQPFLAALPRLILMEMGCHLLDTARFLLGDLRSLFATIGRFGEGHPGEDVAMLQLVFQDGTLGLLDMTWCATADLARPEWALNETVVEGTSGALKVERDGSLLRVGLDGRSERRPVKMPPDDEVYVDGYLATQTHFLDGLRHNQDHETSGLDTLKTMDAVWAAYLSAEQGRVVDLTTTIARPI